MGMSQIQQAFEVFPIFWKAVSLVSMWAENEPSKWFLTKTKLQKKKKNLSAPFVIFRECWKPCLIHLWTQTIASFKHISVFSNESLIICAIVLFTGNVDHTCLMPPSFKKWYNTIIYQYTIWDRPFQLESLIDVKILSNLVSVLRNFPITRFFLALTFWFSCANPT